MNKFNWLKALGFGVLIWAVMFVLVWAAISMGIFSSVWTQVILAIIAGVMTYALTANTKPSEVVPALGYGAVFAAIGIILDLAISQQLVSGLFGLWAYYLTYAVILLAPTLQLELGSPANTRAV